MTQLPRLKVTGQGLLPLNFMSASYFLNSLNDFHKLHTNIPISEMMWRSYDWAMQPQGQGQTSRSCDLPISLPSISSEPFERFTLYFAQIYIL